MYKITDNAALARAIVSGGVVWIIAILVVFFYVIDLPTFDERTAVTAPEVTTELESTVVVESETQSQQPALDTVAAPAPERMSNVDDEPLPRPSEPQTESSVTETVSVEQVRPPDSAPPAPAIDDAVQTEETLQPGWYIQVGAFSSEVNASVERLRYENADFPAQLEASAEGMVRILVGPYLSEIEAVKSQGEISAELKVGKTFIRSIGVDVSTAAAVPKPAADEPESYDQVALNNMVQEIVSEGASDTATRTETQMPEVTNPEALTALSESGWYVQVGAYKSLTNAEIHRLKFAVLKLPVAIEHGTDDVRRVLIGPFASREQAEEANSKIALEQNVQDGIIREITL